MGDPPGTHLLHVELGGVLLVPPVGEVHVLDRGLEGRQLLGDESLCLLLGEATVLGFDEALETGNEGLMNVEGEAVKRRVDRRVESLRGR